METIINLLINNAVEVVAGALATVFIGGVALWAYKLIGLNVIAQQEPAKIIYWIALQVNKLLVQTKDTNLRNELIKDLDSSGDKFNEYWDKGIRGEKIV